MKLYEAKLNKQAKIISLDIENFNTKLRLMELGLIKGQTIKVFKKSLFRKTLLVVFNSACFTLNANLAKCIEVIYD